MPQHQKDIKKASIPNREISDKLILKDIVKNYNFQKCQSHESQSISDWRKLETWQLKAMYEMDPFVVKNGTRRIGDIWMGCENHSNGSVSAFDGCIVAV